MQYIEKNNRFWLWILFIIYPLASFVIAVKNYPIKKYRIFIWLFFMFYGYTFLPIPKSDGSRYKENFENSKEYNFNSYRQDIERVFSGEASNPDFYAPTLKYVAKAMSNDSKVYFMLAAAVYFFVFLKLIEAIWNLVLKDQWKYVFSFFIGCVFIYNFSAGVNGIRFPLAFMVFSYGVLQLIVSGRFKFLIIALVSILIHFAFLYSSIFLVLIYLLKFSIKPWLMYLLLILALSFSTIFSTIIAENLDSLGSVAESKFEGYTGEGFQERRETNLQKWNWYVYFNLYSIYFFGVLSFFLTRLKTFHLKFDTTANRLFVLTFILLIHSLISGSIVDVVSNRFNLVFILFELIYLFYLSGLNPKNRLIKVLNYVYIPILIINILVKLRGDFYTVNTIVVFGNWILALFMEITVSIQDYILG